MKYKAVVFDLFGTLVPNLPSTLVQRILNQMASVLDADHNEFIQRWYNTFNEQMTGELQDDKAIVQHICRQIDLPVTRDKLLLSAELWTETWESALKQVRGEAQEVIADLKLRGYKIGLLSNSSFDATQSWRSSALAPMFNVTIFSCLVGLMKPDPHIFKLVADQLQIKPEECIYVADGMDGELKAAASIGMMPVCIRFPDVDKKDPYLEQWHGSTIITLHEVLNFIK